MRRTGGLWHELVSFDNLYRAFRKCRRGKRSKDEVALFERDLEGNLLELQQRLAERSWKPGAYHAFLVTDTKPRKVVAAPFADRVVHTAVCHILEPVFERVFIHDTYACRVGKGTHTALERLGSLLRKPDATYALKGDIAKFFPSIDHARLRALLRRKVKDDGVLWLCDRILDSYRTPVAEVRYLPGDDLFTCLERPCGLPIGNLTSQLWSTLALSPMDNHVKRTLRAKYYVRYADDFVILDRSKERLHEIQAALRRFLLSERLLLEPKKCRVFPVALGVPFLGFVSFAGYRELTKAPGRRFKKRLRQLRRAFARGEVEMDEISCRIKSWIAHASFGKTWGLRRSLFRDATFVRQRGEGKRE